MLEIEVAGIKFKNPIMPASGCFGFGKEMSAFYDLNILGALVTKSVTFEERFGNLPVRTCETEAGMLNAIGLQNPGVKNVKNQELVWLKQYEIPTIVNIAGASIEEYVAVVEELNDVVNVSAFEINISCPNVKQGGITFSSSPSAASEIVKAIKAVSKKPLFVKLSPNVTDIVAIALAVEKAGADAIVMINTLIGMKIDLNTRKPILKNQTGGLSGPGIKPVAINMVFQVKKHVKIPIIGVGGINTCEDVIEFLLAGASAVQIGMANLKDPMILKKIIDQLPEKIHSYGYSHIEEIIGGAHYE